MIFFMKILFISEDKSGAIVIFCHILGIPRNTMKLNKQNMWFRCREQDYMRNCNA